MNNSQRVRQEGKTGEKTGGGEEKEAQKKSKEGRRQGRSRAVMRRFNDVFIKHRLEHHRCGRELAVCSNIWFKDKDSTPL